MDFEDKYFSAYRNWKNSHQLPDLDLGHNLHLPGHELHLHDLDLHLSGPVLHLHDLDFHLPGPGLVLHLHDLILLLNLTVGLVHVEQTNLLPSEVVSRYSAKELHCYKFLNYNKKIENVNQTSKT